MYATIIIPGYGCAPKVAHFGIDKETEEAFFLATCESNIPDWEGFSEEEISRVLDKGYVNSWFDDDIDVVIGFVDFFDASGFNEGKV